jgi:hypothetical protein
MAIYKNGDSYYLNAVANPLSPEKQQVLPAHEYKPKKLLTLLQLYRYCTAAQWLLIAPAIGYAFINKLTLNPTSFETIGALAALISAPVFVVWLSTLSLRKGVSTFSLSSVDFQVTQSSSVYRFYALSSFNLLIVFISAPWGDGWYLPLAAAPPVGLFAIVLFLASHRILKLRLEMK